MLKTATVTLKITEDNPNEKIFKKLFVAWNFIKKETLAQVVFCEFCEIFKNTNFTEHLWVTVSHIWMQAVVISNLNLSLQFMTINFKCSLL